MNIQNTSNSNNNYNDRIYNCAGHGCGNVARYLLRLVLIKKSGYFCPEYTEYLKDNNLIDSILEENVDKRQNEGGENNLVPQ